MALLLGGRAISSVSLGMGSYLDEPTSSFPPMNLLKPQVLTAVFTEHSAARTHVYCRQQGRRKKRTEGAYTSVPAVLAANGVSLQQVWQI